MPGSDVHEDETQQSRPWRLLLLLRRLLGHLVPEGIRAGYRRRYGRQIFSHLGPKGSSAQSQVMSR